MWYLLYNSLLLLVSPIILFVLLAKQRCRRGLPQRPGLRAEMPTTDPAGRSGCIWIHAVSLGEVVAVQAEGEGVVMGEVNPARLDSVRQQLPALAHRRL